MEFTLLPKNCRKSTLRRIVLGVLPLVLLFGETAKAMSFLQQLATAGQTCGSKTTSSFGLLGGSKSVSNGWPWMASLQFYDPWTGYHNHVCGATLIGPRWAVTAAHCVYPGLTSAGRDDPKQFKLVAGATDLMNPTGNEQILDIERIIQHPSFLPDYTSGFPNDIALIHLKDPVETFGTNAGFACIPDSDMDFSDADECWMSGWGTTDLRYSPSDNLMEAKTKIIDEQTCSSFMDPKQAKMQSHHLCAGGMDSTVANACKGDSGGPLSCRKGQHWFAAGIYSWSYTEDCRPSIFVKLSSYRNWIRTITKI